ncbi:hypothetical protein ABBQ32_002418 [Trebouxia sp. C0010 RCD-2024]
MMSERSTVDVEQLQAELQSARDAFDKWALETVSAADQLRENHIRNIADLKGDIQTLQQRQQQLSLEADKLKQRLSVEKSREQALQAELGLVQAEEVALPLKISKLQEALHLEEAELRRREAAIGQEELARQKTMAHLRKDLETFRSRLGLCFQGVPGKDLSFVFTNIDPNDHARQFIFGVTIQKGRTYTVTSCDPPLKAMEDLVHALNDGSIQFSAFVQCMRRHFQQLC